MYSSVLRPTLPASGVETERSTTRHFSTVNADGSATRVETSSAQELKVERVLNVAGALTTWVSGGRTCAYTAALLYFPPLTSRIGEAYAATSRESCTTPPATTAAVTSISVKGGNDAIETRTVPIGTFNTLRQTQTVVSTGASSATTTEETCWIDLNTGRAVECTSTYRTVPTDLTAPTATGTRSQRLEAYSYKGQASVGPAVRRFAGYWQVTLSSVSAGAGAGSCENLQVDLAGRVQGACRWRTTGGAYGAPFGVSGTVTSQGAVSLSSSAGPALTGTFTSPGSASGAWTNGGSAGTWSALHQ